MKPFEKSKFIWFENESHVNTYAEFIGAFSPNGKNTSIRLSCDGDYTLYINGKYVASNQYGDFEHYKVYDEIDVSNFLQEGENEYFFVVWHFGEDSQRYVRYKPGLIFEIESDGELIAYSGKHIRSRKSKAFKSGEFRKISDQLSFSFSYDATANSLPVRLLDACDFAESVEVEKECTFFPRPIAKSCLGTYLEAKCIFASEDSKRFLFDLGREYVGLCSFELEASEKTLINVSYSEHLRDGAVPRFIGNRDFSFDYVARSGTNTFTSYMLRYACRYLEVNSENPINIKTIGIVPQFYDVKVKTVEIKDATDKAIYDACVRTLELCMMEHYVDCPWREQCLYAFDSRNQMLCGYYAFEKGNWEYVRSNLRLLAESRRADGILPICSPCGLCFTIPSFSLHFITAIFEYYSHTSDVDFVRSVMPRIEEILKGFLVNERDGLIYKFTAPEHWNFYDWSDGANGRTEVEKSSDIDPMLNLLFARAYRFYAKLCEILNRDMAIEFNVGECFLKLKDLYFDSKAGLWEMSGIKTELVNSLAILTGASQGEEAEQISQTLANGSLAECSLSMKCFKYDALLSVNKEKYRNAVLEEIRKTYKPMLETGTVWETAVGRDDFFLAGSLCHGWSSIPIYYFHQLDVVLQ